MNTTTNYNLKLPSDSDIIDVSVLDENFNTIDSVLKNHEDELEPITLASSLEVLAAGGTTDFYHGTTSGVTKLLSYVRTSFGDAVFGHLYGTIRASAGSSNSLYVVIRADNGVIYWDEYCNSSSRQSNAVFIGTANVVQKDADTTTTFAYSNSGSGGSEFSIREAIVELAMQIQALRGA